MKDIFKYPLFLLLFSYTLMIAVCIGTPYAIGHYLYEVITDKSLN